MGATVEYVRDEHLGFEGISILDQDTGDVLEVQRSLMFEDRDEALGMDTYCLIRGGLTHYGGVFSWDLSDTTLASTLDAHAALVLQLPPAVVIDVSPKGSAVIAEHLERLLAVSETSQQ